MVLRHCPLVLLLKVNWKEDRAFGSDEGKVMGSGLSGKQETQKDKYLA
jgi:hypothetical protein